jgi:uncharacterized membrane protein YhaH (DUF805 family)
VEGREGIVEDDGALTAIGHADRLRAGADSTDVATHGRNTMSWTDLLFSFRGRIGRGPYWIYAIVVTVVVGTLFAAAGVSMFTAASMGDPATASGGGAAATALMVVPLLLLWPSLAVCAKRWHDVDKSAWWILIALVPVVGGLVALVFNGFIAGTPGANRFGAPPRAVATT